MRKTRYIYGKELEFTLEDLEELTMGGLKIQLEYDGKPTISEIDGSKILFGELRIW